MKNDIEKLMKTALQAFSAQEKLSLDAHPVQVDKIKDKQHGDYACNLAMILAKPLQRKPREIAEALVKALPVSPYIAKVEIAGPGFINFFLTPDALYSVLPHILKEKKQFGRSKVGAGKKVLLEFVSSNPTGPLHVGHGRHAAFGSIVSDLLEATGHSVYREYYVNDAGRQMDILAVSVWLRYLEALGEKLIFPSNAYKGTYVVEIAEGLLEKQGKNFLKPAAEVFGRLPDDEPQGGDKEVYIDAVIQRAKELLGEKSWEIVFEWSLDTILKDIHDDLKEFGVEFQKWFSERELTRSDVIDKNLKKLEAEGMAYRQDGALWFKATDFGDEKDRVLERANGQRTYFANDLSYHMSKFDRGFDFCIDIFGSDHHGYVPRMQAGLKALGVQPERLAYLFIQFVTLYRSGQQVQMSTRSGSFVTLRELREEVGNDAARYFYVMRRPEQHVDFDLDLAKSQTSDNPVYYVQYAHARICSVIRQLVEKDFQYDEALGLKHLKLLNQTHELDLIGRLAQYPDLLLTAALQHEPHQLTNYLKDLATDFHSYYNSHQFIVDDINLRNARLSLITATRQILANGLELIGVSRPESM